MKEKERKGFDDTDIEKQWDDMLKRGRALRTKYPDMKMPDFLIIGLKDGEENDKSPEDINNN